MDGRRNSEKQALTFLKVKSATRTPCQTHIYVFASIHNSKLTTKQLKHEKAHATQHHLPENNYFEFGVLCFMWFDINKKLVTCFPETQNQVLRVKGSS
jgi:hypothetical protein